VRIQLSHRAAVGEEVTAGIGSAAVAVLERHCNRRHEHWACCWPRRLRKAGAKFRGADKIEALLNGVPFKDGILAQDNPPEQQLAA
jgi:hypothetical protein